VIGDIETGTFKDDGRSHKDTVDFLVPGGTDLRLGISKVPAVLETDPANVALIFINRHRFTPNDNHPIFNYFIINPLYKKNTRTNGVNIRVLLEGHTILCSFKGLKLP
jgi:hypothetical protein